jgi:hypothetical protein
LTAKDDNRCWPGYEPVKGKEPHSQGSCRPKAEKKLTSPEKTFRAKRKRQLAKWQADHPSTRKSAAQHLHAPDATSEKSKTATKRKASKRPTAAKKRKSASKAQKRDKK